MPSLLRVNSILYNAFFAIQDTTNFLPMYKLVRFCNIIRDIFEAREQIDCDTTGIECDLFSDEDEFYHSSNKQFLRRNGGVEYYGKVITQDVIDNINSEHMSKTAQEIIEEARMQFRNEMISQLVSQANDSIKICAK